MSESHAIAMTETFGAIPGKVYRQGDPLDLVVAPHQCSQCRMTLEEIEDSGSDTCSAWYYGA